MIIILCGFPSQHSFSYTRYLKKLFCTVGHWGGSVHSSGDVKRDMMKQGNNTMLSKTVYK